MEKFEWTSKDYTTDDIVTRNGTTTVTKRLTLSAENPQDIIDMSIAFGDVQSNYLGYDADAMEEEWFDFTVKQGEHEMDLEGAKRYFDKYAEEMLKALPALDPTAWKIFKYVTEDSHFERDCDCDDHMAYGLFGR